MSQLEARNPTPTVIPAPIDRSIQTSDHATVGESAEPTPKGTLIFDRDAYIKSGSYKQLMAMYRSNPYAVKHGNG